MARRERQTCSQRPVRSEQRRQTAQGALALRVAPLLFASPALLVSRRPLRVSSSSRLGETKNRQQRGMVAHFNRLLTERYFAGNPCANRGASCATGFDLSGTEAPLRLIASS